MRLVEWERFDRRAVAWSLRVFGLALLAEIGWQAYAGVWRVAEGALYPWRHLAIVPLEPPWALVIEWALGAGAGVALVANVPRARASALRVAALVTLLSALERYSNHGALLFLVAAGFAMAPPALEDPAFDTADHPTLGLLRAQLAIVYGFSALNKVTHGFLSGRSLENLLGLGHPSAVALSIATVVAELALPVLLVVRPRAGLVGVALLHLGFGFFLAGLLSFGATMFALTLLFLAPPRQS